MIELQQHTVYFSMSTCHYDVAQVFRSREINI